MDLDERRAEYIRQLQQKRKMMQNGQPGRPMKPNPEREHGDEEQEGEEIRRPRQRMGEQGGERQVQRMPQGQGMMRPRGMGAAADMIPPLPNGQIMMDIKGAQKQYMTGSPATPLPDTNTNSMYYLNKVVQGIIIIIILVGLFFIPRNLCVLWLIIFGLLFLSSVGLELFGSWITLSQNSNDPQYYQDAAKYTLYTVTIMFAAVFIALLLFFAWRLIIIVRDSIQRRNERRSKASSSEVVVIEEKESRNDD